jgi:hypothetical protein
LLDRLTLRAQHRIRNHPVSGVVAGRIHNQIKVNVLPIGGVDTGLIYRFDARCFGV